MKYIIMLIVCLISSLVVHAQTNIPVFKVIKKPLEVVNANEVLTNVDSISMESQLFSDSLSISSIILLEDTLALTELVIKFGNDSLGIYNLYIDTILFDDISTSSDEIIYRNGNLIFSDHGTFFYGDTLFGEVFSIQNDSVSTSTFYPILN